MFLYRFLGISGITPLISKPSQQTFSLDLRTLKKCEFCLQLEYPLRGNQEWRYTIQYPDFPRPLLIWIRDQVLLLVNAQFQKIFIPPPPPPTGGNNGNSERREGGGGSKMRQLPRGWGGFPGAPSKIDELFKTNSCPVEEAISHFPVNSLLKQ